jgi:hypothetical protein
MAQKSIVSSSFSSSLSSFSMSLFPIFFTRARIPRAPPQKGKHVIHRSERPLS